MLKTLSAILIILLTPLLIFSQDNEIGDDFCITKNEYRLYKLIDSLRVENNLSELQLSVSLSFVAKTHVKDLNDNNPDTSICNMNSWSDKGNWRACCHNKYLPDPACIVEKPKELTNYKGEGHELAYWEFGNAIADSVFQLWNELDQTREFLLGEGKWDTYKWESVGVGIYNGYASIWLGELPDNDGIPGICDDNGKVISETKKTPNGTPIVDSKQNRYYIIFGSLPDIPGAQKEADKFRKRGFPNVKIIQGKNKNYRISLNDYSTLTDAKNGKKLLGEKYQSAWILHY